MAVTLKSKERARMAKMSSETVKILEAGSYEAPDGTSVSIDLPLLSSADRNKLYTPKDLAELVVRVGKGLGSAGGQTETRIEVTPETSLAAAFRLTSEMGPSCHVALLNFASAKNPGGGFRGGSRAQEESLARASGLYAALTADQCRGYYAANRPTKDGIYTDHLIWSLQAPVFRGEGPEFALLNEPWTVSMVTSPATNAGVAAKRWDPSSDPLHRPFDQANRDIMSRRIEQVLSVCVEQGVEGLVLGAWGCGAFGNKEADIAALFRSHLLEGRFANVLKRVVFAVYVGKRGEEGNLKTFQEVFGKSST